MDLGLKIKERRTLLMLTQEELANRCELTKGYISQLENNKVSPSFETLQIIIEILGCDLSTFFAEKHDNPIIFTKEEQYEKFFMGYKQTWLVPNSQDNSMEPILVEVEPGATTFKDYPHSGEEFGYVVKGEVTVVHGDLKTVCRQNESFYFISNADHYLMNNGKETAVVVWVSTPPNF